MIRRMWNNLDVDHSPGSFFENTILPASTWMLLTAKSIILTNGDNRDVISFVKLKANRGHLTTSLITRLWSNSKIIDFSTFYDSGNKFCMNALKKTVNYKVA